MVKIERVELNSTEMVKLVDKGHRVRETPHLGGPYSAKYALTLGGAASDIVLVDTIKAARDKFGRAGDVAGERFVSNKQGERIPAASLRATELGGEDKARLVGVMDRLGVADKDQFFGDKGVDLVGVHTHCVESVVAQGVSVATFGELWQKSGDAGTAMMEYMAGQGNFRRWYDSEAKKVVDIDGGDQKQLLESQGAYFEGNGEAHGLLPSVEALFAIEAVSAAVEGRDITYDHLYVMSTRYTQEDAEFNERVLDIAHGTLALLGVTNTDVTYRYIIADNERMDEVGGSTNHFEMMEAGRRFDAETLIEQWEACNA